MKNYTSIALIAGLSMATTLALPANAKDNSIRVVVTPKKDVRVSQMQHIQSASMSDCALTPGGEAEWCLDEKSRFRIQAQSVRSGIRAVTLDSHGYDTDVVIEKLSQHYPQYHVEADIPVTQAGGSTDPEVSSQQDYFGSSDDYTLGMNVYAAWEQYDAFSGTREPIPLVIMDSSFFTNPEVDYAEGASFVTVGDGEGQAQAPSDNYLPRATSVNAGLCNGHGMGVAATAAANGSNGIGASGVTNNVIIHPYRVMDCGSGYLSDTAKAFSHLAGEVVDGVTPYSGKPGVINLSLGGNITGDSADYCPAFMQEGIDKVLAAGWSVVVAAGNYSSNENRFTPANCDGVIVAGSYSSSGTRASFSNYGPHIDFVTEGEWVVAPCNEDDGTACFWEGTSFSSPLVAGIVAFIREQTGITDEETKAIMAFTANRSQLDAGCETESCGNGVPDLVGAMSLATMTSDDAPSTMSYALNDKTPCEQEWVTTHFGNLARVCETISVNLFEGKDMSGFSFEVLAKSSDQGWDQAEVVDTFDTSTFTLADSDLSAEEYGVKICKSGDCLETVFDIDTSGIQNKPAICE